MGLDVAVQCSRAQEHISVHIIQAGHVPFQSCSARAVKSVLGLTLHCVGKERIDTLPLEGHVHAACIKACSVHRWPALLETQIHQI